MTKLTKEMQEAMYDPAKTNTNLSKSWFAFQKYILQHPGEYSSAHEMAIWRAITTSNNILQAAKKLKSLQAGRLEGKVRTIQNAIDIIENMMKLDFHLYMYDPDIKAKAKEVLKYTIDKLLDPTKRCEPSICKALEAKNIPCDTVDVKALIDSSLSCTENMKNILREVGARKTDYRKAELKAAAYYAGTGKLKNASPQERAAAFASMRETGTLRGYDTPQRRFEKQLKAKAQQGKKLRGQQTLTSAVSTSKRLSEYEKLNDPKQAGIPKAWFAAMLSGIKKSSDVRNPYAIVNNIWARLPAHTQADIKRKAANGETFKYNLPLPTDLATRGSGTLRIVKPFKLAEAQVNVKPVDMKAVKASGIFKPMKRIDGSICQVARCKGTHPVNIFVDEVR